MWMQDEIQDSVAVLDCLHSPQTIASTIKHLRTELFDLREHLISLQQNKTTMKRVWLLVTRNEVTEEDLEQQI